MTLDTDFGDVKKMIYHTDFSDMIKTFITYLVFLLQAIEMSRRLLGHPALFEILLNYWL